MKCDEWIKAVESFAASLPPREHEWDNITRTEEKSHYICRHCLVIEERMKTIPGVRDSE